MSPAEHHRRPRSWMTAEDRPDHTTERHLQDMRDAADDRRATTDRERIAHERPGAGSESPMSSRKGG